MPSRSTSLALAVTLLLGCAAAAQALAAEPKTSPVSFGRDILPILRERCFRCHEGKDNRAGVRLDVKAALLGESGSEALVVPGKGAASRLVELIRATDENERMPPQGPRLTAAQIDVLARWIDEGVAWDANLLPERDSAADHWAFQPVGVPAVAGAARQEPRPPTLIDYFITAAHENQELVPAREASRRVLARRLYFDLWGLPPTWDDLRAFTADQSPDAVEQLVDSLLASPRYGEQQARHWLDVARWAESEGFESNHPRAHAWRYRDYVVQSFNSDKPFSEFITQQLAGDELPEYSDDNLIATGYLAAARISSNEEDKALQRNDVSVDIVNAVGSGLLGLTLHCAQCHDHKFDPISARDYYALHAFFTRGMPLNAQLRNDIALTSEQQAQRTEQLQAIALQQTLFEQGRQRLHAEIRAELKPEEKRVYDLPTDVRSREEELLARKLSLKFQKSNGELEKFIDPASRKLYDELKKRTAELDKALPPPAQTFAFYSPVTSPHEVRVLPALGFYPLPFEPEVFRRSKNYVLERGEVHQLGAEVGPAFPSILKSVPGASKPPLTRRELARWLTSNQQPLVPRVWVNRLWQQHFGRGIVVTADDFGLRGARPTHPELLDWLATTFIERDWSTKRVQRLIVTSNAYRQSTESSPGALSRDPDNRWLTRHVPRRLTAEQLHDAWLAASGELDNRMGGISVALDQRETSLRRSLYLFQRRGQAPDVQRLFDGPQECSASVARREVTTSPLQSLYLLNSPFASERSRALAKQLESFSSDRAELLRAAFRRILLREPEAEELAAAAELWDASLVAEPLASVCQALLNLNEFNYVE